MAAPATCVITSPTNSYRFDVGPADSKTLTITGTTDASVAVELFDGVTSKGTGTATGGGAFTFSGKVFAIGTHVLTVRAGTDPDFTTSAAVTIVVADVLTPSGDPTKRSVDWYLNYLAGTSHANLLAGNLVTAKDAACTWAGVSSVNYGLVGALNVKAGITDREKYVSVNAALNLIAYSTTNLNACRPWLTDQQALQTICLAV